MRKIFFLLLFIPSFLYAGTVTMTQDGTGTVLIEGAAATGTGTPGGSNTQVQFNDGGSFNGDAGFVYDKTAAQVTVTSATITYMTISTMSSVSQIRWADGTVQVSSPSSSGTDTNTMPPDYWRYPAGALLPLEPSDSIPPILKDTGTNLDQLPLGFNDSTDECRSFVGWVSESADLTSNATFYVIWMSSSATTGNVIWYVLTSTSSEGVDPDKTMTTTAASADAVQGTVGQPTTTIFSASMTTLGFEADGKVDGMLCRDANNASDTMTGDAWATMLVVKMAQSP